MKKLLLVMLALLLTLGLASCVTGAETPPAPEAAPPQNTGNFSFTPENYPKMGGSLAALPLGQAVTAAALGISREDTGAYIRFEGSTTDNYRQLIYGSSDILLAYEPSEEALRLAQENGFTWELTPIGRDALVFIANKDNPVHNLTDEQIRSIYSGSITNWSQLGGNDAAIIAYQRNEDSGSQTLFNKLLNLGGALMKPPSELIIGSMIGLLEVVADYDSSPDALGYTVYYYLTNMEPDKLSRSQIFSVNGIACNNDTIRSGEYPYVNDFYAVIPANLPEDAPARVLYNWICSEQGRELAERENYVAL